FATPGTTEDFGSRDRGVIIGLGGDCDRILGKRPMFEDRVSFLKLGIHVRAETEIVVLALRGSINPSALVPAEGTFLIVIGGDVLTQFWADGFEQIPTVSNNGEIA